MGNPINPGQEFQGSGLDLDGNANIGGNLVVLGSVTVSGAQTFSGSLTASGDPGLILTNATSRIVPGATSLSLRNHANGADNLLVTDAGAVTVRAGLTVTAGGLTVAAGGLTVTAGGATITAGGLTVTAGGATITAGALTMGAAASQLVPGATSFSIRDHASANDNLLVADAGTVTIRAGLTITAGGLTVTAGGITVTAGSLVFGAAASVITPGATSLAVSNNAVSQNNLLITDAGVITLHNKLYLATDGAATQSGGALYAGPGAPNNANGANGDFYFNTGGTHGGTNLMYHKEAGSWVSLGV